MSVVGRCLKLFAGRRTLFETQKCCKTQIRNDSTYKAAIFESPGTPLKIAEVKPKKLKKGQGVNPSNFTLPITPGYEMCGTVMETNDCQEIEKGDRVVALNKEDLGGFAEQCVVDQKDVWRVPSSLGFKEGASLVDSFGTAQLGLTRHGQLAEKQVVLVTMAPTHGYAPLDLAANVYKAKVIAVSMAEAETELMRERGAWSSMSYNEKLMLQVVKDLTKSKGVNVIYDTLAGEVLKACLKCVAHEGHIIVAGYTLKELPPVQMSQLLSLPSFSISGVSLRSYRKHAFETYRQTISDVLEMYDEQLIKPEIAATFPLKDVNEAIQMIKEKQPVAKIILEISK